MVKLVGGPFTESHDFDGVCFDGAAVTGVITSEFVDGADPVWVSAFSPRIFFELARLAAFCYDRNESMDVGFIPPKSGDMPPAIVVGDMDADRWVSAAPRDDTDADPASLEVFDDA